MKISEIKKASEAVSLLNEREQLMNKQRRLVMIFGSDEYTFPNNEAIRKFITDQIKILEDRLDKIREDLRALGVEEDVEW